MSTSTIIHSHMSPELIGIVGNKILDTILNNKIHKVGYATLEIKMSKIGIQGYWVKCYLDNRDEIVCIPLIPEGYVINFTSLRKFPILVEHLVSELKKWEENYANVFTEGHRS